MDEITALHIAIAWVAWTIGYLTRTAVNAKDMRQEFVKGKAEGYYECSMLTNPVPKKASVTRIK